MRIDVTETPLSNKGMSVLRLAHNNKELSWDVSVYDRVSFADIGTVFDCINDYWATQTPATLNSIWELYEEIHHTLQNSSSVRQLDVTLQNQVQKLYALMPYEQIRHWVNYKADVKIPSTILQEYGGEGAGGTLNYPRELTYLRSDYQELAVLSVALRPMVPIWGEYIKLTEEQTGGMFKEDSAMSLLYKTPLTSVDAMSRLEVYMEHWVAAQPVSHSAILEGLGTAKLPSWLLAGCIVRRIVFGRIHAIEEKDSMIANIFRYVNSTMKSIDGSFNGKVNAKKLPMEMNEEDNSSLADMYKVKQEFSDADMVTMNIYTENMEAMVMRLDPTLSMDMVKASMKSVESNVHRTITEHQIRLAQWVIHPVISPRGIPYLNKASMMRVLAVTQAALWHWGFFDLASLVTAIEKPPRDGSALWGSESRSRIPKEMVDTLEILYKHYRRQRGKGNSVRQLNVAYRAIDQFCELISKSEWQLNAPAAIAAKVETLSASKIIQIPPDIRLSLAKFMELLARR